MKTKTFQEIKTEFDDSILRSNFIWNYSLCILLENCLIKEDYHAPQSLNTHIVLTANGEEIASEIKKKFPEAPEADVKLALFVKLYYYDLFIDLQHSNMLEIEKTISQDVATGRIKYPWVFDRVLYDRFFEKFPNLNHQRALSYEETLILLENSHQGVFQVQDFLVGPFGILRSNIKRELIPTTSAPLWHCPDPSCEKLHTSNLTTADSLISKLLTALPFLTGNWVKSDQNVQTKGVEIVIAITASIEHLDLQIDSFGKSVVVASNKEIQNLLPPVSQCFHEGL